MGLSGYTKDDLSGLTPEELSALENDAGDEDGAIAEIAASGEETGESGAAAAPAAAAAAAGADGAGAAAAPAAASAEGAAGAEGGEAAAAAAGDASPGPAPSPSTVVYRTEVGDVEKDIAAQKDAIKAARADEQAALKKLNDGEIEFDEYLVTKNQVDARIDDANEKILDLRSSATRAQVADELTTQQQAKAWKGMLSAYVGEAKKAGLDFVGNEALRGEFNSLLKAFATEASEKGLSDDDDMAASRWALEQAREVINMRHKAAAPPTPTPAPPPAKPGAPATPAATPAPTAAPAAARDLNGLQVIGGLPNAAPGYTEDTALSKLGALQGEELELALAKLPPAEVERILAGSS